MIVGETREGNYRRRLVGMRREHRTVIRHSDEEWARVTAMAKAQGVSVPRLYERAIWAGDVVAAARLSRIVGELGLILRVVAASANNINQVAKVANSTGEVSAPQVLAAAEHLERQLERVRDMLNDVSRGQLFQEEQ